MGLFYISPLSLMSFQYWKNCYQNFLNCDTDLKDRKSLTTKHDVAMVVTVDYSNPSMEPEANKEENNRAYTRSTQEEGVCESNPPGNVTRMKTVY